jgi:glutathione S-transferase
VSSESIRVWGVGTSRTMRAHWILTELNLLYETREILPRTEGMEDPEFNALNHRGKVPVLQHGDLIIGESGAIVFYLADRFRERCVLAPSAATPDRAVFDDLCFFTLTELDAPLYVIRRHAGLPDLYGESPVAVKSAGEYFLRQAGVMERRLADGRSFLLGDAFSGADLLLSTCLAWARMVQLELPPRLEAFQARISRREAYRAAFERNFPPSARALLGGTRALGAED